MESALPQSGADSRGVIRLPIHHREVAGARAPAPSTGRDALEQLIHRYESLLLAEAYKYCRDAADAQDLVQETLVRFLQHMNRTGELYEERRCVLRLLTILTHAFFDQCRRQSVRDKNAQDLLLAAEVVERPESMEPPLFDSVTGEMYAAAKRQLSPKLRITYELYAAGMTYQDIADVLCIPRGTVGKRLVDARAKLRELLLEYLQPGEHGDE